MFENAEVVMEGTWVYGGSKTCNVRIIKWDISYGSGDYEDSPEIRDDKDIECYYVQYESMISQGHYSRSRAFLSVEEAMQDTERAIGGIVNWIKR